MTEQQLDAQGEARDALSSVVADFGPRVLSDPRMLGSRMSDLLPDLPKERQLLLTAAEADVAGELRRHVQEQHLDPNTAVQLVARSLTDRQSIDPTSSMWVATQYAQALGYPVQPGVMPPPVRPIPPSQPTLPPQPQPQPQQPQPPFGQHTVTTYGYQDPTIGASGGGYAQPQPPSGGGGYSQPPSGGAGYYPQQPVGGQAPPTGAPQQGTPAWTTPQASKPRKRGLMYGVGGAAAAVVIIIAVGFGTHWFGPGPNPKPTPPPTTPPVSSSSTSPVPTHTGLALAAGIAPLTQLLPSDVNPANCNVIKQKAGWGTPGLVTSLNCYDSALPKGRIYGYQFDSSADYRASWSDFNTWWPFKPPSGSGCPPSSGDTQGMTPWFDTDSGGNGFYPTTTGQTLECGSLGSNDNQPAYAWSFPTEDAYIVALGNPNMSLSALQTWWASNADPNQSPSPSP
ncbi:MAG: hypothetical protein ACRDOU_17705 [Streptosporangiaceae bacterium]